MRTKVAACDIAMARMDDCRLSKRGTVETNSWMVFSQAGIGVIRKLLVFVPNLRWQVKAEKDTNMCLRARTGQPGL
jgi:hypothetical protein